MKKLALLLAILIPLTGSACSKKSDDVADSKLALAQAEAEKAKAEAEIAKAEAEKAKADAEKVKAEAGKAEAEAEAETAKAEAAKAEAEIAKAEAEQNDDTEHVDRYTAPENLPDLDGTVNPRGLVLVMGVRPERGIKMIRAAGTENGTYLIEEIYDGTIAFSNERRKGVTHSQDAIENEARSFAPDARDMTIAEDKKMSKQLSYPSWKLTYITGNNEDTRKNVDYYIQTDEFDFRIHTSIAIDQFNRNKMHLDAWFENLKFEEM